MSHVTAGALTAWEYEQAARAYQASLPLEHYMESTPQATQREITVESMALLKRRRPDLQYFNELLVQYLFSGQLRQVVPDNMAILSDQLADALSSYNVELERVRPFVVWEYVSPSNLRKDYLDSFGKYEQELRVPYYVLFYPEAQDLRVHHHTGEHFERMEPDTQGRCTIAEVDLQVGLLHSWLRYWYRGTLLELPGELEERMEKQAQLVKKQAQEIGKQSEQILQLENRADALANELRLKDAFLQQSLGVLRGRIAERARQAGRTDILTRLPETSDLTLLSQWLSELG